MMIKMRRLIQFIKDWTLPVSIVTGSFLYLVFAFIPALESAATVFAPILDAALPLFMFLVLYVTFCKVDFCKLIPVGWHLWIALSQVLMVAVVIGAILFFMSQVSRSYCSKLYSLVLFALVPLLLQWLHRS